MHTSLRSITENTNRRFTQRMDRLKDLKPVVQNIEFINPITEEYSKERHFTLDILDIEKFVKVNELQEITNPVFFIRDGIPTSDGLLSNSIFGITKEDRAGTFAYINLGEVFLHPLCYKIWAKLDSRIKNVVHSTTKYIIDSHGDLVEDEKGETGVSFLKKNFEKIKIKSTGTTKRDVRIKFLEMAYQKGVMFTTKYPVIPAYYRDVDTSRGRTNIGEINEMYSALLNASRALKSSQDYGLTLSGATRGRIQECLLNIYNWFTDEPQLSKKFGVIKRAALSKTTDYACRLVISSPRLNGERASDLLVDVDHCGLPLAAALTNFYPFVMYYLTSFFTKEFSSREYQYPYITKNGEYKEGELDNWQEVFSPVNIKAQLDRYIQGFSNRFIPIEIPIKGAKGKHYMAFKGYNMSEDEFARTKGVGSTAITRPLTWCDLFFMAAVEVTKDRCILITRYPIDSCYNQYPSLVRIMSTVETEPLVVNGTFYQHYPHIRAENIGMDTSNIFIDTLNMANPMCKSMGADYDGDQVTTKGVFFEEANAELRAYINSRKQFIDLSGKNMRVTWNEGAQSLFNLTLVLPDMNINSSVKMG